MKLSFEKQLFFFFLTTAIVFVTLVFVFSANRKNVEETSARIIHNQEVLRKSDRIILDVLNIETGSRAFAFTGRDLFLETYYKATSRLNTTMDELSGLTAGQPVQQRRISELQRAVGDRIAFAQNVIDQRKKNGTGPAEKIIAGGGGKILTDRIESIINRINAEEQRLLDEKKRENDAVSRNSRLIFYSLMLFTVALTGFVVVLITQNQKSRNRYEFQLSEYKYFFLNSNELTCIASMEGYFEKINPRFEVLLGHSMKEMTEHPFLEFVHADDRASTLKEMEKLGKGITTIHFVNRFRKKDGEYLLFDWNATPDNKTGKIYAIARDITRISETEAEIAKYLQQLEVSNEQLAIVNKELEGFSYSVSHDLRAPLRAINGYARILEEDYLDKFNDEGKNALLTIIKSSRKMGELIDALLSFSKMGRKELVTGLIDMESIVRSVVAEETFQEKQKISIDIGSIHPAKGDQILIKQVWTNLISNAIKYSRRKPAISITIDSFIKDGMVVYKVNDNGAGFDMEYYDKLFGVFQRLHSQEEFQGTGIGLAIVHKIIHRHQGKLWAESKVNEGSCFYFSLPSAAT
jgi:PAS domain S-box-containing protein